MTSCKPAVCRSRQIRAAFDLQRRKNIKGCTGFFVFEIVAKEEQKFLPGVCIYILQHVYCAPAAAFSAPDFFFWLPSPIYLHAQSYFSVFCLGSAISGLVLLPCQVLMLKDFYFIERSVSQQRQLAQTQMSIVVQI